MNNKCADQPAQMRRLVCTLVVRMQQIQIFESRSHCTKKMKVIPYEPVNEKTDLRTHAPNEDSDQYGHLPSLITVSLFVLDTTSANLTIELTAKTDLIKLMCRLIRVFTGQKN